VGVGGGAAFSAAQDRNLGRILAPYRYACPVPLLLGIRSYTDIPYGMYSKGLYLYSYLYVVDFAVNGKGVLIRSRKRSRKNPWRLAHVPARGPGPLIFLLNFSSFTALSCIRRVLTACLLLFSSSL